MEKIRHVNEQTRSKRDKLQEDITKLNDTIKDEQASIHLKQSEFKDAKTQAEDEKIRLERFQQEENKLNHDLLMEKDRAHNIKIDMAESEVNLQHVMQERKHHRYRSLHEIKDLSFYSEIKDKFPNNLLNRGTEKVCL